MCKLYVHWVKVQGQHVILMVAAIYYVYSLETVLKVQMQNNVLVSISLSIAQRLYYVVITHYPLWQ